MISAGQASAWPKFAHILGHDEWIDIPEFQRVEDRVKNRVLLAPMIAEETSKFEKNVLLERLAEAKIAAAPVMTVADVANDPHFRDERSMYTEVTHPQLGPVRITNQAVKMSETNPYVRGCAPLLGEHNDEVYQFLGFTPEEISAWRERALSELPLPPDLRLPPPWVVGRHRPKQNRQRGTPGCTPGSALPLFVFLFSSAPVPPSARTGGCWTGWTGTAPRRGAEAADGGPVPPAWHGSAPTPR